MQHSGGTHDYTINWLTENLETIGKYGTIMNKHELRKMVDEIIRVIREC